MDSNKIITLNPLKAKFLLNNLLYEGSPSNFFNITELQFSVKANRNAKQFEDSLVYSVANETNLIKKLDNYINLIHYYQLNNFEKAFQTCDSAFNLAEKANNKKYRLLILIEKIRNNFTKGDFNQGKIDLEYLDKEIKRTDDDKVLGNYFLLKNFVSDFDGDIVNTMGYGIKALNHFLSISDTNGLAKTYNNIGVTYDNIGNTQKAVEYYLIASDYAILANNNDVLISTYNNLGVVYNNNNNNEKAQYYYKKALDLAYKSNNVYTLTGELNNIALIYLEEQKYRAALTHFHEALLLTKKNKL